MAPKRSQGEKGSSEPGSPGVRSTKKPRLDVRGEPVVVTVGDGEDAAKFSFPEELLLQHSDFAKAALKNGWTESEQRTIHLQDQEVEHFEIFATFVYTGKIHSSMEGDSVDDEGDCEWRRLLNCWILGDMLQSHSFKDATVDAIIQKRVEESKMPTELHMLAYPKTVRDNSLRRLAVDIAIFDWSLETLKTRSVEHGSDAEFFRDVCVRFFEHAANEKKPWSNAGCKYHEHGTAKPCYKTMF